MRAHLLAKRKAAAEKNGRGFVSQTAPTAKDEPAILSEAKTHNDAPAILSEAKTQNKARAEINRANAQHSTGPRSVTGKLASSRNSTKHGLASGVLIIPGEDPAAFEALLNDLITEHQPATPSEELLIKEMAQSHWLTQRAIRLQNTCFTEEGVDHERTGRLVPVVRVNEKKLALYLRYQTTHQRAFHKALHTLLKLKKQAARAQSGFVSQPAHETSKFVPRNDSSAGFTPGFVSQHAPQPHKKEGGETRRQAA